MWFLVPFLVVPLIEIWLFIVVGSEIGALPTIGLVLLTAVLGVTLMRMQGQRAWMDLQRSMAEFRDPTRPVAHGAMIALAGMLLIIPGFFTDALGLLLLIPQVRDWVLRRAGRSVRTTRVNFSTHRREPHRPPFGNGIIDADFVEIDPHEGPQQPDPGPDDGQGPPTGRRVSGWTQH